MQPWFVLYSPQQPLALPFLLKPRDGGGVLRLLEIPYWFLVVLSVIVLDFAVWAQHVFFHAVPALWRPRRIPEIRGDCRAPATTESQLRARHGPGQP